MERNAKKRKMDPSWEQHQETIKRLYIDEEHTLQQVRDIMAKEPYNFQKSIGQFDRATKDLGIRKNLQKKHWKAIKSILTTRGAIGKQSVVVAYGRKLPESTVKKETWRNSYETTLQRVNVNGNQTPPTLPQGITVRTPSPVPERDYGGSLVLVTHNYSENCHSQDALRFFSEIPWLVFQQFIEDEAHRKSSDHAASIIIDPVVETFFDLEAFDSDSAFFVIPHNAHLTASRAFDVTLLANKLTSQWTIDFLKSIMPLYLDGEACISTQIAFGPPSASARLEFFRLAVYLLSNKIYVGIGENHPSEHPNIKIGSIVVDLLQCHHNRNLLKSLLQQGLTTIKAFAEILLGHAAVENDVRLLKWLLGLGVHPDSQNPMAFSGSPLVAATQQGSKECALLLLQQGANPIDGYLPPLEHAIRHNENELVRELLRHGAKVHVDDEGNSTLAAAVKSNSLVALKLIVEFHRDYFETMLQEQKQPTYLAAASAQASLDVVKYLLRYGEILGCWNDLSYGEALVAASSHYRLDTVNYFLSRGVGVGARVCFWGDSMPTHHSHLTALEGACWANDQTMAELLLDRGAAVNSGAYWQCAAASQRGMLPCPSALRWETSHYPTALQWAALHGNLHLIQRLLGAGADLHSRSCIDSICHRTAPRYSFSGTTLQAAVLSGSIKVVKLILKAGASFPDADFEDDFERDRAYTYCNNPGESALLYALRLGNSGILDLLEEAACHSGDPGLTQWLSNKAARSKKRPERVLWAAVESRNINMVERIAAHIAKAFVGEEFRRIVWSALPTATRGGCERILELMISWCRQSSCTQGDLCLSGNGKVPNSNQDDATTKVCKAFYNLIKAAFRSCNADAVRILLQELPLKCRPTVLSKCLLSCCVPESIVRWFLLNEDLVSREQLFTLDKELLNRVLKWGCESGDAPLVRSLLSKGVDPNGGSYYKSFGRTYLQLAADHGHSKVVEVLLEAGAKANAPAAPYRRMTALQAAAARGNFSMARQLLEAGADVNAAPAKIAGLSALEAAAARGRLDMVRFLLNAGANIKGRLNGQYRRAVGIARLETHRALAEYLQDYKQKIYGAEDCQPLNEILESPDVVHWDESRFWERYWGFSKALVKWTPM